MQTTLSSDFARAAEQDDCLKERLTVYETFMFYAHLRLCLISESTPMVEKPRQKVTA